MRFVSRPRAAALFVLALVAPFSTSARAQSPSPRTRFVVSSAADGGTGSLRKAITDANAAPGEDTIEFALPSGSQTIRPRSPLPAITGPVTIDGATEPGYSGAPLVEIDGSNAGAEADGLVVSGDGYVTIRALVVNGFAGGEGIVLGGAGSSRVLGCYVGTTADGGSVRPNGDGIRVVSPNNVVGGAGEGEGNVVSGNTGSGVGVGAVFGVTNGVRDNVVIGNRIGTDASGTRAVGNGGGIDVTALPTRIGGHAPGEGNVVSGNGSGLGFYDLFGVRPGDSLVTVEGNLIGTDASGSLPLGNDLYGVILISSSSVVVGGRDPGAGNVIAYNGASGIYTRHSDNFVYSNSIFGNVEGSREYYDSAGLVFPPTITSVSTTADTIRIRGGLDSLYFGNYQPQLLQFFANDACETPDAPQGKRFLGEVEVTTNDNYRATFDVTFPGSLPPGGTVTATTTTYDYVVTSNYSECAFASTCEAPFIVRMPTGLDAREGERVTIPAEVNGSAPLRAQWFILPDGANAYTPIAGATSLTLTTPPLTAPGADFKLVVDNGCGENGFYVYVTACVGPPVIDRQPKDVRVGPGQPGQLYVTLLQSFHSSYRWYEGASGDTSRPIDGAIYSAYNAVADASVASRSYWVRITNSCGSVDSEAATVVVAPIITDVRLTTDASGKAELVVTGTGFTDTVNVGVGHVAFIRPSTGTGGTTATASGKLTNGLSFKKGLPRGQAVDITVTNSDFTTDTYVFTRR